MLDMHFFQTCFLVFSKYIIEEIMVKIRNDYFLNFYLGIYCRSTILYYVGKNITVYKNIANLY